LDFQIFGFSDFGARMKWIERIYADFFFVKLCEKLCETLCYKTVNFEF